MKRMVCICAMIALCHVSYAAPIKALIVDGQNNHDWKTATPVMQKILLDTGIFAVDVATSPPEGGDMAAFNPKFADYGVIVLNYAGDLWNKQTCDAFLDYVSNGGGVVVVHAADNSFGQWKEYNEIIGFGGWGGRTKESGPYNYWNEGQFVQNFESDGPAGSHEGYAEIVITNRVPDHPILKGMPEQWRQMDELYNYMRGPGKNMTILATAYSGRPKDQGGSGRHEPMLVTISYGKGRVFHTALGHDARSMECKGFVVTFARGAQWAATGEVTIPVPKDIPAVLQPHEEIGSFDEKQPADCLIGIFSEIGAAAGDPVKLAEIEDALDAYLNKADTPLLVVQTACNALGVCGTKKSIPALAEVLSKSEQTSDAARLALERMNVPEAGGVLIAELQKDNKSNRIGIVNSLGVRRESRAVPILSTLSKCDDAKLAAAAIAALGKIENAESLAALQALPAAPNVADALLDCAHNLANAGNKSAAIPVFNALLAETSTSQARRYSALLGILVADPDKGMAEVWKMLDKPETLKIALSVLGKMPGEQKIVESMVQRLDALPASTRVALMPVLGSMAYPAALPKVVDIAQNAGDADLKGAAIDALGSIPGNAASVKLLCAMAVVLDGPFAKPAHAALVRAPGAEAEDAIISGIAETDGATQLEFIKVAADRRLEKACGALLKLAVGPEGAVQIEALNALRVLGGPKEYEPLIALAAAVPQSAQEAAVRAVKYAGRRVENPADRVRPYLQAIEAGNDAVKAAFLGGLADIGGPDALKAAETYARADNQAVRAAAVDALAHWKEPAAIDSVLGLAAASAVPERRVEYLKAFSALMARPSDQPVDAKLAQCRKALEMGLDVEGKRALLDAIAQIVDASALELIERIGEDPALAEDAKRAAPAIKQKLLGAPVLTASHNQDAVDLAIDGNPATRWSTNTDMKPGMWFMADLRMRSDVSSIELDTTRSAGDYPRGYEVYVSNKADDMGKPVATGRGDGPVTKIAFGKPVNGRFIKIVQTGQVDGLWWSIHELRIAHNPGFPETPPPVTRLGDIEKANGFITQWNAAGPYTQGDRSGEQLFDVPFGPESDARCAFWVGVNPSSVNDGVVDLQNLFGGENRGVYLVCTLSTDKAGDAEFRIGSDDGIKVWLNKELVHSINASRPVKKDEDKAAVHLKQGDNTLLLKVVNKGGNWGACIRVVPQK